MKNVLYLIIPLLMYGSVYSQKVPASSYPVSEYAPLTLKVNDDGSKFIRFIIWHQQWLQSNNLAADTKTNFTALARRSRFLAYAQVSPRFMILTHFGLNSLSQNNMSSLGNNGDGSQLFLHDAWAEFKLTESNFLFLGGGLHYWKGLTRLSNQSTLNFMTLDNPRPFVHWHSLGITDQFARHMGFYVKGEVGKFDYRIALNNPLNPANSINGGKNYSAQYGDRASSLKYLGSVTPDGSGDPVGNSVVEGYFRYQVFDKESTKLPYQVGTYHGNKKVLAVGAGFYSHLNGMYDTASLTHQNIMHLAGDVFLDMPINAKDNAINAYLSVIHFDYGKNFMSRWAGTGTNVYGHFGYFIRGIHLMPYVAYQSGKYDSFDDNLTAFDAGVNYFVLGHNAKLTLEYHSVANNPMEVSGALDKDGNILGIKQIRFQMVVFL